MSESKSGEKGCYVKTRQVIHGPDVCERIMSDAVLGMATFA